MRLGGQQTRPGGEMNGYDELQPLLNFIPFLLDARRQRVLFALFAAILVAVAEAGLYLIWQYSKTKRMEPKKRSSRHKKVDSGSSSPPKGSVDSAKAIKASPDETLSTLRQRR